MIYFIYIYIPLYPHVFSHISSPIGRGRGGGDVRRNSPRLFQRQQGRQGARCSDYDGIYTTGI